MRKGKDTNEKISENLLLMAEYRSLRLWDSKNPVIPDMLWHVILLESYLSIATTFFLPIGTLKFLLFFTLLFTNTVCILLFIALQFNYPYRGHVEVEIYCLLKLREDIFPSLKKFKINRLV